MTNGEKYKTAQECAKAYCQSKMDTSFLDCNFCEKFKQFMAWLELEAEEEKPLPCPFCGNDNLTIEKDYYGSQVNCLYCGYRSIKCGVNVNPIAAHNRVAKKCREV